MKNIKQVLIGVFLLMTMLISCESDLTFDKTPSERSLESIDKLSKLLTEQKKGWQLIYFPNTDSLIFSNPSLDYKSEYDFSKNKMGYGGVTMNVKFLENGEMEYFSDEDEQSSQEPRRSHYKLQQGSLTQLTFSTYNSLHRISNSEFKGKSDFFYIGHDLDSNLVFSTLSYYEPAREYIVLRRLKSESTIDESMSKTYENLSYFEGLSNAQIFITQGDRIYFKSDHNYRKKVKQFRLESLRKRYYMFIYRYKPGLYAGDKNVVYRILGSGYAGTEDGLVFHSGIRVNSKYIFYDFIRQDDVFISELVKIYDPTRRKIRYIAKHKVPQGIEILEDTKVKAIIKNVR